MHYLSSSMAAAVVQKTMDAMPMVAFPSDVAPSLHDDASAVDDDVDCHHS